MARKVKRKTPQQEEAASSIVKLRLQPTQAKIIRVAAAINSQRPGEYAREIVLEQARKDLKKLKGDLE